jgi:hypothetical protein
MISQTINLQDKVSEPARVASKSIRGLADELDKVKSALSIASQQQRLAKELGS